MRDRQVRRQKSERPSWQASPVLWLRLGSNRNPSTIRQHLAKLLGGRRDDGNEVSLAQPALDAVAFEVAARSAMKHRRVRGGDTGLAEAQAKRQDAAPIAVVLVERVAREFHSFRFKIGKQFVKV